MIIIFIILSSILFCWNFQQQKAIRALRGNYDKVCHVLAGELNVEDVKRKLEDVNERKLVLSDGIENIEEFPLTIKNLNILRKKARKKRKLGAPYDSEFANKWILPVICKKYNTGYVYYRDKNNTWLISSNGSDELVKTGGSALGTSDKWQIILDSTQIKKLLK